jgi:hypothetical protein
VGLALEQNPGKRSEYRQKQLLWPQSMRKNAKAAVKRKLALPVSEKPPASVANPLLQRQQAVNLRAQNPGARKSPAVNGAQ